MAVQDEVPKSRITLRYKTEVDGEAADVQLPLRLLVMGDFSLGTSKDRKLDLEERKIRNLDGTNTNAVMKDMGMSIKTEVANKIDPENAEKLEVNIPISSMKSFSPDQVAQNVPKLRALMTMRKLLLEINSNMGNSKELRKLIGELYADEAAFNKLREDLKAFEGLKVPTGAAAAE